MNEGDELLLSDALIKLRVNKVQSKKIYTTVERGGKLKPHQGLNKKGGDNENHQTFATPEGC